MKKIILATTCMVYFCLNVLAQKNDCNKVFLNEKKSSKKSTVFSNDTNQVIKTQYCGFYVNGNRSVSFSFIKDSQGMKLQFISLLLKTVGIDTKREIILGQNIKIAFIFEDGTNEIIQFKGTEQDSWLKTADNKSNQNEIVLTNELLNKLCSTKIVDIEFQNPFNLLNDTPVKQGEVKKSYQERIILIANCFKNKIQ